MFDRETPYPIRVVILGLAISTLYGVTNASVNIDPQGVDREQRKGWEYLHFKTQSQNHHLGGNCVLSKSAH